MGSLGKDAEDKKKKKKSWVGEKIKTLKLQSKTTFQNQTSNLP